MNECNSIETFRLDEISEIENYFIEEINQRKSCSKKLSEYVAVFDYIDFNCFNTTSGGVSTISFTSIVGAPVGIASAGLTLFFSLTTGIVKKSTEYNRKQKEKT